MIEPILYHSDVRAWLLSVVGNMIHVVIVQNPEVGGLQQVIWKGQCRVVRCLREGVMLDLQAGEGSWWSKLWGMWGVQHVVPRWSKKPVSFPYGDLSIDLEPATGVKRLVIDAVTWERSPGEFTEKKTLKGNSQSIGKEGMRNRQD